MEAVVGVGESFVVAHHQLSAELVVVLSYVFEFLAFTYILQIEREIMKEIIGKGKSLKAVGRCVPEAVSKARP